MEVVKAMIFCKLILVNLQFKEKYENLFERRRVLKRLKLYPFVEFCNKTPSIKTVKVLPYKSFKASCNSSKIPFDTFFIFKKSNKRGIALEMEGVKI